MHRTRIKFCGITRAADAVAAADAGADAIGLIFYDKSPRHVSIDQAGEILAALPPMVSVVGLFVNETVPQIVATARTLNIRTVQLHGDEPPDCLSRLHDLTVIKAIRCTAANLAALAEWHEAAGILLETAGTSERGGTGVVNDWDLVEKILQGRPDHPPLIAAGGLMPENVAAVVRQIRPWAVDVSSGIEDSPGVKSAQKMHRFAESVREADLRKTI